MNTFAYVGTPFLIILLAFIYILWMKNASLTKSNEKLAANLEESSKLINLQSDTITKLQGNRCGFHKFDFKDQVRRKGKQGKGHIITEILLHRRNEPNYRVKTGAAHHSWILEHQLELGE